MKVLLVEDNLSIVKGLSYSFEKNNYEFAYTTTVEATITYLSKTQHIDMIILDVALPDGNGFDLYNQEIKDRNIPTIFLTARDNEDDVVLGLNLGADDYIIKPFSTKELLARVHKVILRSQKQHLIKVKDITFDADKLVLYHQEQEIKLAPLELKIVNLLFTNLNKTVSRNTMLDRIWEWTGNFVDDHTITVYLKRIREKIGTDIIVTIKGWGYRIDE